MSDVDPPPVFAPPTSAGALGPPPSAPTLAVLSLVLGIIAATGAVFGLLCLVSPFAAIPGIAAIALGWISLAKRKPGRGMAWAGLITGIVGLLIALAVGVLWAFVIYSSAQSAAKLNQNISKANVQQIAQALRAYAKDNKGALPPTGPGWEQAIARYITLGNVFESPHADDPTAASLPSYIYAPGTAVIDADPKRVLVYENPALNAEHYAVVYADGHVRSMTKAELDALIAALPTPPAEPK